MKLTFIPALIALCLLVCVSASADGIDGQKVWHTLPNWNVMLDFQSHSGDYTLYLDGVETGQLNNLQDTYWQKVLTSGVHELILEGDPNQTPGRLEAWLFSNPEMAVHFLPEPGTECEYYPGGVSQGPGDPDTGPSQYVSCQASSSMVIRLQFVAEPNGNP